MCGPEWPLRVSSTFPWSRAIVKIRGYLWENKHICGNFPHEIWDFPTKITYDIAYNFSKLREDRRLRCLFEGTILSISVTRQYPLHSDVKPQHFRQGEISCVIWYYKPHNDSEKCFSHMIFDAYLGHWSRDHLQYHLGSSGTVFWGQNFKVCWAFQGLLRQVFLHTDRRTENLTT